MLCSKSKMLQLQFWIFVAFNLLLLSPSVISTDSSQDAIVAPFLQSVNTRLAELYNMEVLASWQNEIRGPNDLIAMLQSEIATKEIMNYIKEISPMVTKLKRLPIADANLRQQLAQVPKLGYEALNRFDLKLMYEVTSNMSDIYKNVKLCAYAERSRCNLSLIPDVQDIIHASHNVDEIVYYWLAWRQATGISARASFAQFVELYRKAAALNGYSKPSDFWFKDLEENSREALDLTYDIITKIQPIFRQFHAHVRSSLRKIYGSELVKYAAPYPQNLAEIFIGNSYRSTAKDKLPVDLPYPEYGLPNITQGLLQRGLNNPQRVFLNVAEYYRSMGLTQLEDNFWSSNAQPTADPDAQEAQLTCWHKAWKYYGGMNQVNLSYCPYADEQRFLNMYETVSDIYYYRAYQQIQPTLFQEEPIPHFADAIGKVFSLAASTPRYLEKLHLIDEGFQTKEARLNRLYIQGLRTIFLIPVFYVLDRYRIEVLDGNVDVNDNCAYWKLTEVYTGAEPPVPRTNADFDAPAKLLMEVDDQYTSQIMSIILQFQLYRSFCLRTGQYKPGDPQFPLDLCDLSNQKSIGPIVQQAMSLGASKSYKEILQLLTNESSLSVDGLLEYFQPLYDWLLLQNRADNAEIEWQQSKSKLHIDLSLNFKTVLSPDLI